MVRGKKGRKKIGQAQLSVLANSGQVQGAGKTPTNTQTTTGSKTKAAAAKQQQQQQKRQDGQQSKQQQQQRPPNQQQRQQQQQKESQQQPRQQQQQQGQQGQQTAQQSVVAEKKKSRRANKAPAVVLTLPQEGTVTMAEAMLEVRGKIALNDLDIERVRPRRSVTGAMILEIPGPEAAPKADKLAARITEVLAEKGVKVSRPVKTAELRITGMDDSISPDQVKEEIVKKTKCARDSVKVGNMVASPSGLFSLWVRCPQTAADALGDRLLVGWVSARIAHLPQRPLQCFKCLEAGHAGAACKSTVDRSKRCFRCGREDRKSVV